MVIDFRGRPPTREYLEYFNPARISALASRFGVPLAKSYTEVSVGQFVKEMDEAGIAATVALGRNSPAVDLGARQIPASVMSNDHVVDLVNRYPGRIIGMAGIDVSNKIHDAITEIDTYVRGKGLKGIFIEPQRALNGHPDDKRIYPVYEKCIELDVPVAVMSGPFAGPDISYTNPVHIDRVATQFPNLKIVCSHGCWPYVNETVAVAFKHPNVYVSPDVYHFVPGAEAYIEAANTFMADQLLFATCYPVRPLKLTVDTFKALPLRPASLEKALHINARRLLRI